MRGVIWQNGDVDLCIVGSDRTTLNGDGNKIGTYLKALSVYENKYLLCALPTSTIDKNLKSGNCILIETRSGDELSKLSYKKRKGIEK